MKKKYTGTYEIFYNFSQYKAPGGDAERTCLQELGGRGVDFVGHSIHAGEVLHDEDVWRELEHVLLAAAGGHAQ